MAQLINVLKTNENNDTLVDTGINFARLLEEAYRLGLKVSEYPFLMTIDEYGNTWMNRLQAKPFSDELTKFKDLLEDEALDKIVSETLLLTKSLGPHDYIKFLGD